MPHSYRPIPSTLTKRQSQEVRKLAQRVAKLQRLLHRASLEHQRALARLHPDPQLSRGA